MSAIRRRGRKSSLQNLLRALKLDYTLRIIQPVPLPALCVVRLELGMLRAHGVSLSDHEENREGFPPMAAKVPQGDPQRTQG